MTSSWHDEILAVITEPLGLRDADLPAYGTPGPGCCRFCLAPAELYYGLCAYCATLEDLIAQAAPQQQHRPRACGCRGCARMRGARLLAGYAVLLVLAVTVLLSLYWTLP